MKARWKMLHENCLMSRMPSSKDQIKGAVLQISDCVRLRVPFFFFLLLDRCVDPILSLPNAVSHLKANEMG